MNHPMNQLRLDPLTGRWVVVSTDRAAGRLPLHPRVAPVQADTSKPCPFCPGNEGSTPPALETYGKSGSWLVRVVPNLYPAFEGDDAFVVEHRGPVFTQATAGGIHEVLVLSPDHDKAWDERRRRAGRPRHGGDPGPHRGALDRPRPALQPGDRELPDVRPVRRSSTLTRQLLGMSFVPRELAEEQAGFARFTGRCLLCTTIDAEESTGYRVVYSDERVRWSARSGAARPSRCWSSRAPTARTFTELARRPGQRRAGVAHRSRAVARGPLGDVPYNLVFHSAPFRAPEPFHWHVHIRPKLATTRRASSSERACSSTSSRPEQAADELRVAVPVS